VSNSVLIIGSGPAGYTAAIYAARAGLKPTLVTGAEPGGQLTITTDVENYPGFDKAVTGPELVEHMRLQAEQFGTVMVYDHVQSVERRGESFAAIGQSGDEYLGDAMIIATGAKAKWLGLESEQRLHGRGVSACATCDGFFYRQQRTIVVGGGNTAVEEALYLSNIASHVTLVHRGSILRAEKIMQDRLFERPNVTVRFNTVVDEILGDEKGMRVTGVRARDVRSGDTETIETDGVFVAIGHAPSTEIFEGFVTLKAGGYVEVAPGSTATNVPGVFAAGDVADDVFRQAVTAAGMGCMAALEADRWLASRSAQAAKAAA